ncbi:transposase [Nonomuraea sp. CA-143628]|uniref:transposase n=1 Tax=Nonomuraea sp. CA-143628 TaxID=3239997 RepID=UPI003D8B7CE8
MGLAGDLAGGRVDRAQGRLQRRRLLGRRQELHLHHQSHHRTHYRSVHVTAVGIGIRISARGRTVVHRLHAHVVFTPIHRRKVFIEEMLRRCEAIMIEVCDTFGTVLAAFNGEHDHERACWSPPYLAATSQPIINEYIDNQKRPD